jgi:deoxyribonuclease V
LRTKDRVSPLFVSPGHLCDMESCIDLVLSLSGKYRLPQPTRMAHDYVNQVRREAMAKETSP